jgi:predicted dehydrogenase
MVIFNDLSSEERIKVHDKGVSQGPQLGDDLTQPPMSYRYGDVVSPHLVMNEPLMVEDEHFTDCVLSGMVPLTGGANGLAVVEVLEAAQLSAVEGREVLIEEVRGTLPAKVVLDKQTGIIHQNGSAAAIHQNGSASVGDLR